MEGNIQNIDKNKEEGEFDNLWLELLGLPVNIILDYAFIQIAWFSILALPHTMDLFGKIILIMLLIISLGVVTWSIPGYIDVIKKLIKAHKIAHNKI